MSRFTLIDLDCQFVSIEPMGITLTSSRIRESVLRPALITVMSSANIDKELSVQALSRLLMYSRKIKGPSTDPWGKPHKTLPFFDDLSRKSKFCNQLLEKV